MKQIRLKISGKVQGVFFRAEAQIRAKELDLAGWVRNTNDGGVEAVAQGESNAIEKFIAWCRRGPKRACVDHVKLREEAPETFEDFRDFLLL